MFSTAALRRPGRNTIIALVLVLLVMLLLVHGMVMGVHHVEGTGCATCIVAILALLAILFALDPASMAPGVPVIRQPRILGVFRERVDTGRSRHPPDEGTVLLI